MSNDYTRVAITEARDGDEVYQAGEWCRIDGITTMPHSSNVSVRFTGGGIHNAPAHHFTARRKRHPLAERANAMVARVRANVTADERPEHLALTVDYAPTTPDGFDWFNAKGHAGYEVTVEAVPSQGGLALMATFWRRGINLETTVLRPSDDGKGEMSDDHVAVMLACDIANTLPERVTR